MLLTRRFATDDATQAVPLGVLLLAPCECTCCKGWDSQAINTPERSIQPRALCHLGLWLICARSFAISAR